MKNIEFNLLWFLFDMFDSGVTIMLNLTRETRNPNTSHQILVFYAGIEM